MEYVAILDRVLTDIESLIDSNNDVENSSEHASPAMKEAQRRGNALRIALKALQDAG